MAYQIKYGDTLSGIASQNNTDINSIMKLNPSITDPNKIQAGAFLVLPNLSSEVLSTAPAPILPMTPVVDNTNKGIIDARAKVMESEQARIQAEDASQNEFGNKIKSIIGQTEQDMSNLAGMASYEQQQLDQSGANEIKKRQRELANQMKVLSNEAQVAQLKTESPTGAGETMSFNQGYSATQQREYAIRALTLNSENALLSGQLETAKEDATRAVELKYGDAVKRLDQNSKLIELYKPFMTNEQNKQAEIQTAKNEQIKTELADKKKLQTDAINFAQTNGDATTASKLLKLSPDSPTFINDLANLSAGTNIKTSTSKTKTTEPLSILDVQRYQELYPDAGIIAGDTETQANAKIQILSTPEVVITNLVQAAKDNGNSYETVISEINNDKTITDKNTAKKIANFVYGKTEGGLPKTEISAYKGGTTTEEDPVLEAFDNIIDSISNFLF